MNKKIFFTLLVLLIAAVGLTCVSAFDLGFLDSSDENETVTIDGIDFNVPNGFEEDPDYEYVNETSSSGAVTYVMNGKTFEKGDQFITILVSDYGEMKVTDEVIASLGGEKVTINDIDGYEDTDEGYVTFSYPKDGKLVVLSSDDDTLFEDFLIA